MWVGEGGAEEGGSREGAQPPPSPLICQASGLLKPEWTLVFFPRPVWTAVIIHTGLCVSHEAVLAPISLQFWAMCVCVCVCVCVCSATTIEGWKIDYNYIPAGFWRLDRQLERNLPCSCRNERVTKRWVWREEERPCPERRKQYNMDSVHSQRSIFKRSGLLILKTNLGSRWLVAYLWEVSPFQEHFEC